MNEIDHRQPHAQMNRFVTLVICKQDSFLFNHNCEVRKGYSYSHSYSRDLVRFEDSWLN